MADASYTKAIADSSYVIALLNRRERDHGAVARTAQTLRLAPWLVTPALTEICFVLHARAGPAAVGAFLNTLQGPRAALQLLDPEAADYARTVHLLGQYTDSGLDFVDALIVSVAERLKIDTVLTLDRRHFGVVRPVHCAGLTLLPVGSG